MAQDNNKKCHLFLFTFIPNNPTTKFMVNQHPFLLKPLAWVDNNNFPFQQHLKMACNFLPPQLTCVFFPFEQLIGQQQMVRFQIFILECLHHHTISSMLFDMIFETHHAQILSCFSLEACAWLTTWLTFPTFLSYHFPTVPNATWITTSHYYKSWLFQLEILTTKNPIGHQ